jgi:hypothetical protein
MRHKTCPSLCADTLLGVWVTIDNKKKCLLKNYTVTNDFVLLTKQGALREFIPSVPWPVIYFYVPSGKWFGIHCDSDLITLATVMQRTSILCLFALTSIAFLNLYFQNFWHRTTGGVVSTPASYIQDPGFKSRPADMLPWQNFHNVPL